MPLNLTVPGFGGGGRREPAPTGRIINETPPKTAKQEAEEVFKKSVSPNTANTSLYYQYTGGGRSRTQQRTMTDASKTFVDAPAASTTKADPKTRTSSRSDTWDWGRSKLGGIARALKALTGI